MRPSSSATDDQIGALEALYRRVRATVNGVVASRIASPITLTEGLRELKDTLKTAVQKPKTARNRYHDRFLHIPVGCVVTDPQGVILEANLAAGDLFGLSPDRLQGTPLERSVPEGDRPIVRSRLEALRRGEEVAVQEISIVRPDGAAMPIAAAVSAVRDSGGRVAECCWILRDISMQKRMEEALRESERRYRELTESISDIFIAVDRDNRLIYWNRAAERISGVPAGEVIGKSLYDVSPPLGSDEVRTFFREVLETRRPGISECRFRLRGREYFFDVHASYPTREGVSVYISDSTARKHAEEALRRSEERYRGVIESQTELIYRWLPDSTVTFANDAYCRYIGVRSEDLIGHRYAPPTVPPEDRAIVQQGLASLRPDRPVSTVEHRVIMPGGEIRWQQ